MICRFFGLIIFIMGITMSGWIGYNLFIERLPEAQGGTPVLSVLLSIGFLYVGVKWMRGEQAG